MIEVVPKDSGIYNAADATGHERGFHISRTRGKVKCKRIYSVHRIENGIAHCQSWDVWGQLHSETFKVETLEPHSPEKR